jgi:hypothetical protein
LCCVAHFFDFKILIKINSHSSQFHIKKEVKNNAFHARKVFFLPVLEQKKTHLTESGELIYCKPAKPIILLKLESVLSVPTLVGMELAPFNVFKTILGC